MNSQLKTQSSAPLQKREKDDFAELRDREFVSQINQMRKVDNWTNWRYFAIEYLYLAAVMGIGFLLSVLWAQSIISTWVYAPLVIVVSIFTGIGQHRLVMLGHEASHFALFKNKKLNELASDWLCFYPIWVTTYNYRIQHMAHHQHTNDPELDPDYAYMSVCGHQYTPPMERKDFLWRCVIGPALAIPNQLRFLFIRIKLALDWQDVLCRIAIFDSGSFAFGNGASVCDGVLRLVDLSPRDNILIFDGPARRHSTQPYRIRAIPEYARCRSALVDEVGCVSVWNGFAFGSSLVLNGSSLSIARVGQAFGNNDALS